MAIQCNVSVAVNVLFLFLLLGASHPSIIEAQTVETILPEWVVSPKSGLKSIGIARKGALSEKDTYKQAFDRALQSLNANRRTWLLAEHYDRAMNQYDSFYEFSIEEYFDSTSVQLSNRFETDEWLFIELEVESLLQNEGIHSGDEYLEAVGNFPIVHANPHYSFEKAKQQAMKELANQTQLKVMGSTWEASGYSNDLFFIKSRVQLQFVEVKSRWIKDGRCYVHIQLPRKSIKSF